MCGRVAPLTEGVVGVERGARAHWEPEVVVGSYERELADFTEWYQLKRASVELKHVHITSSRGVVRGWARERRRWEPCERTPGGGKKASTAGQDEYNGRSRQRILSK